MLFFKMHFVYMKKNEINYFNVLPIPPPTLLGQPQTLETLDVIQHSLKINPPKSYYFNTSSLGVFLEIKENLRNSCR